MKNLILIFFLLWQTSKAQPIYFNINGSFVYVNSGVQSITTSSGTTTLTKFSVYMTIFNGSQPQTIVLPDATTLVVGNRYKVENSSTGLITVQTNGGASLWIIAPGAEVDLTVSDISTAAGQWEKSYRVGNLVSGKFMQFNNSLVFSGTDASTVAFPGNAVLSGTNSGDNAVNTLYSGLVSNANHTGDATGATALTLATVNGNVGSFGSATQVPTYMVNAKGLITAASNINIAIPQSAVTNLVSDLALKAPLTSAALVTPTFSTGTIGIPVFSRVTGSNVTTTGQTLVNITGLSNALTTNATYEFEAVLSVSTSAVTTGTAYGVNYSVAGGTIESQITGAATSTASKTLRINALNTATTLFLATSAQTGGVIIKGIITTGANAGNLTISHLKLTSGTSTVFINSFLKTIRIL